MGSGSSECQFRSSCSAPDFPCPGPLIEQLLRPPPLPHAQAVLTVGHPSEVLSAPVPQVQHLPLVANAGHRIQSSSLPAAPLCRDLQHHPLSKSLAAGRLHMHMRALQPPAAAAAVLLDRPRPLLLPPAHLSWRLPIQWPAVLQAQLNRGGMWYILPLDLLLTSQLAVEMALPVRAALSCTKVIRSCICPS